MEEGQNKKRSEVRGQRSEVFDPNSELPLSVYMITYNNGATIERALQSVSGWADEVVVVDSHSTDGAQEIIIRFTDKLLQHDTKISGRNTSMPRTSA